MSTIYNEPGAGWDRIDPEDYFTSYFKTNEMVDVVQQEKIYNNTTTVGRDHITLMTMRNTKTVCSKSNERKFVMCVCVCV